MKSTDTCITAMLAIRDCTLVMDALKENFLLGCQDYLIVDSRWPEIPANLPVPDSRDRQSAICHFPVRQDLFLHGDAGTVLTNVGLGDAQSHDDESKNELLGNPGCQVLHVAQVLGDAVLQEPHTCQLLTVWILGEPRLCTAKRS